MSKLLDLRTGLSTGIESPDAPSNTMLSISTNDARQPQGSLLFGAQQPQQQPIPQQQQQSSGYVAPPLTQENPFNAPQGIAAPTLEGLQGASPFDDSVPKNLDNPFMPSRAERLQYQQQAGAYQVAQATRMFGEGSPEANWVANNVQSKLSTLTQNTLTADARDRANHIPVKEMYDPEKFTPSTAAEIYAQQLIDDEKLDKRLASMSSNSEYVDKGYVKPIAETIGKSVSGMFEGNTQNINEFGMVIGGVGSLVDLPISSGNWLANRIDDLQDFVSYENNFSPRKALLAMHQHKETTKQRADAYWDANKAQLVSDYADMMRIRTGGKFVADDTTEREVYAQYLAQTDYARFTNDWDKALQDGVIELTPDGLAADTLGNAEAYTALIKKWNVPTEVSYFDTVVTGKTVDNSGFIGQVAKKMSDVTDAYEKTARELGVYNGTTAEQYLYGRNRSGETKAAAKWLFEAATPEFISNAVYNAVTSPEDQGLISTNDYTADLNQFSKERANMRKQLGTSTSWYSDLLDGGVAWAKATWNSPLQSGASTANDMASVAAPAAIGFFNPVAGTLAMGQQITNSVDESIANGLITRRDLGLYVTDADMQQIAHIANVGAIADYLGDSIGLSMAKQAFSKASKGITARMTAAGAEAKTAAAMGEMLMQAFAGGLANRASAMAEARIANPNYDIKPEDFHKLIAATAPGYGFGAARAPSIARSHIRNKAMEDDAAGIKEFDETGIVPARTGYQALDGLLVSGQRKAAKKAMNAITSATNKLRDTVGSKHNVSEVSSVVQNLTNPDELIVPKSWAGKDMASYNPVTEAIETRQSMRETLRDIRSATDPAVRDSLVQAFNDQSDNYSDAIANISNSWSALEKQKGTMDSKEYARQERIITQFTIEQMQDNTAFTLAINDITDSGELSPETNNMLMAKSLNFIDPSELSEEAYTKMAQALGADPTPANTKALNNLNTAWEINRSQTELAEANLRNSGLDAKTMEQVRAEVLDGNKNKKGHLGVNAYSTLLANAISNGDAHMVKWVQDRLARWIASRKPKKHINDKLAATISLENALIADLHDRAAVYHGHMAGKIDDIQFLYERTPAISKKESQPWAVNKTATLDGIRNKKTLEAFSIDATAAARHQNKGKAPKPPKPPKDTTSTVVENIGNSVSTLIGMLNSKTSKGITKAFNDVRAALHEATTHNQTDKALADRARKSITTRIANAATAVKKGDVGKAIKEIEAAERLAKRLVMPVAPQPPQSVETLVGPIKPNQVPPNPPSPPDNNESDTAETLSAAIDSLNIKSMRDNAVNTGLIDSVVGFIDALLTSADAIATNKKIVAKAKTVRNVRKALIAMRDNLDGITSAKLNGLKQRLRKHTSELEALIEADTSIEKPQPADDFEAPSIDGLPSDIVTDIELSEQDKAQLEKYNTMHKIINTIGALALTPVEVIKRTPVENISKIIHSTIMVPLNTLMDSAIAEGNAALEAKVLKAYEIVNTLSDALIALPIVTANYRPKNTTDALLETMSEADLAKKMKNPKFKAKVEKQDALQVKYESLQEQLQTSRTELAEHLDSIYGESVNEAYKGMIRRSQGYLVLSSRMREAGNLMITRDMQTPEDLDAALSNLKRIQTAVHKLAKEGDKNVEAFDDAITTLKRLYEQAHKAVNTRYDENEIDLNTMELGQLAGSIYSAYSKMSMAAEAVIDSNTPVVLRTSSKLNAFGVHTYDMNDRTTVLDVDTLSDNEYTSAQATIAYEKVMSSNAPFNDLAKEVNVVRSHYTNLADREFAELNDVEQAELAKAEKQYLDVLTKGYREGSSVKSNLQGMNDKLPEKYQNKTMAHMTAENGKPLVRSKGLITMRINKYGHFSNGAILRSPELFADMVYLNYKVNGTRHFENETQRNEAYAKAYALHGYITDIAGKDAINSPMLRVQEGPPVVDPLKLDDKERSQYDREMRHRRGTAPSFIEDPLNLFMVSDTNVADGYNTVPYELKFLIGLASVSWMQSKIGNYEIHKTFSDDFADVVDVNQLSMGAILSDRQSEGLTPMQVDHAIGELVVKMLTVNLDPSIVPADYNSRLNARLGIIARDVLTFKGYVEEVSINPIVADHYAAIQKRVNEQYGKNVPLHELSYNEYRQSAFEYGRDTAKVDTTMSLEEQDTARTAHANEVVSMVRGLHPEGRATAKSNVKTDESYFHVVLANTLEDKVDDFGNVYGSVKRYSPEIRGLHSLIKNGYFTLVDDITRTPTDITFVTTTPPTRESIEVPANLPVEIIRDQLEHHSQGKYVFRKEYIGLLEQAIETGEFTRLYTLTGVLQDEAIENIVHPLLKATAKAERDAVINELGYVLDSIYATPEITEQGYYMTPVVWDIGRIGYKERLNPQMYKSIREFVTLENQQRVVTKSMLDNAEDFAAMAYGVSYALGVDDKASAAKAQEAIQKGMKLATDDSMLSLGDRGTVEYALEVGLLDMSMENLKELVRIAESKGYGIHGNNTLAKVNNLLQAYQFSQLVQGHIDSYNYNMYVDIDGKTNGFFFLLSQTPKMNTAEDTVEWLQRVGTTFGDAPTLFNTFITAPDSTDAYQSLGVTVSEVLDESINDVFALIGLPLVDAYNKPTKFLRELFKQPFMVYGYSAGNNTIVNYVKNKLAEEFIATLYNRARDPNDTNIALEISALNGVLREREDARVKEYNKNNKQKKQAKYLPELTVENVQQNSSALRLFIFQEVMSFDGIGQTIGASIAEVMDNAFDNQNFIKSAVNDMLGHQWDVFTKTRSLLLGHLGAKDIETFGYITKETSDRISELTKDLIPYVPYPVRDANGAIQGKLETSNRTNVNNMTQFDPRKAGGDFSIALASQRNDAYLKDRTDYSHADPDLVKNAGLEIPESFASVGANKPIADVPHWSTRTADSTHALAAAKSNVYQTRRSLTYANAYSYAMPGVRGMPFTTLSTDAYVMTKALSLINDTQVSNMFDGTGVSPWDVPKVAKAFNSAAVEAITNADTVAGVMEATANVINNALAVLEAEGIAVKDSTGASVFNISSELSNIGLPAYTVVDGEITSYEMTDYVANVIDAYLTATESKTTLNLLNANPATRMHVEQYIMPTHSDPAIQLDTAVTVDKPLLSVPIQQTGFVEAMSKLLDKHDQATVFDSLDREIRGAQFDARSRETDMAEIIENNTKARLGYDGKSLGDEIVSTMQGNVTPLNGLSVIEITNELTTNDVGLSAEHKEHLTSLVSDLIAPMADKLTDHTIKMIEDLNAMATQQADGNFNIGANEVVFIKGMDYVNPTSNKASNTEVFLHEVIHAITLPALILDAVFRQHIANLFNRAKKTITVESLMDNPEANDPADRAKAEGIYNYVFRNVGTIQRKDGSTAQYTAMAEFVAYAATNERMRRALSAVDASELAGRLADSPYNEKLWHKMMSYVVDKINDIVNWFTGAPRGLSAQEAFDSTLVGLMAANEKAKVNIAERTWDTITDKIETVDAKARDVIENISAKGDALVDNFQDANKGNTLANASYASAILIKAMQMRNLDEQKQRAIMRSIAVSDKPINAITEAYRNLLWMDSESLGMYIVDVIRGVEGKASDSMQKVLRTIPRISQGRESYVDDVRKLLRPYRNEMTAEESVAITEALQADVSALYAKHGENTATLLSNEQARKTEIANLETSISARLGNIPNNERVKNSILGQSHALAQEMMYGTAAPVNNPLGIITGVAHTASVRKWFGNIPQDVREDLLNDVDQLTTLHALNMMSNDSKLAMQNVVINHPMNTPDSLFPNVFGFMERIKAESVDKLFDNNPYSQRKGYLTSKLNNNVDYVYAMPHEVEKLEGRGYEASTFTVQLPGAGSQVLMYRKTPVTPRHREGAMPVLNESKRGESILEKYKGIMPPANYEALAKRMDEAAQRSTDKQFFNNQASYSRNTNMVKPTRDYQGRIVDFTVLVPASFKREVLNREMDFVENIARTGGSVIGKVDAKNMSLKTYNALLEDYDSSQFKDEDFIWVHGRPFNADGSENRFHNQYRMMPEAVRAQVEHRFRGQGMPIRKGMAYNVMGAPEIYITQTEFIKRLEARHPKFLRALQLSEGVWKEMVRVAKARIAVLDLKILQMNYISNFMVNVMAGTNPIQIVRDYVEGIRELERYSNTQRKAVQVRARLATAKRPQDIQSLTAELQGLEMSMVNSPIREMLEEGMFQSITDEVQLQDDTILGGISDKVGSKLENALGRKRARQLTAIPRNLFMTADSTVYKAMSRVTQYNDFVARYSLIKQLKHKNTLLEPSKRKSHEAIMQEAMNYFINYSKPDHPTLQYLNDIGVLWFTKYYLGIQKMVWHTWKNYPTAASATILGQLALGDVEDIFQDSMTSRSPLSVFNNPLTKTFNELLSVPLMDQLSYALDLKGK